MFVVLCTTDSEEGKLIQKEEMERGSVSYKVYLYYLGAITYDIDITLHTMAEHSLLSKIIV